MFLNLIHILHNSEVPGDFAQRVGLTQLTEEHGDKLAPAGKSPGVPLGLGSFTNRWNSIRGNNCNNWLNMLQNLFMVEPSFGWYFFVKTLIPNQGST